MLKRGGGSSRKNVTETVVQIDVYIKTKDNFKDNEIVKKNVKKGKKINLFFFQTFRAKYIEEKHFIKGLHEIKKCSQGDTNTFLGSNRLVKYKQTCNWLFVYEHIDSNITNM